MNEEAGEGLGPRMRAAAQAAGLSSNQLGRALGVTGAAVRAWWEGRNRPKPVHLVRYGELVGMPVEAMVTGLVADIQKNTGLAEDILAWLDIFHQDMDPVQSFEILGEDVASFTPEVREALRTAGPKIVADLAAMGAGEWSKLTEEQRLDIAKRIQKFAEANRRKRRPK